MRKVLTIAGSDSGGGAGIQADLKTFAALGVWGTCAVTSITAQNTMGVSGVHSVPPRFVEAQIEAVFTDTKIDAVKTGMLCTGETINSVAGSLQRYQVPLLVVDPVMVAGSGHRLMQEDAWETLIRKLFPISTLVTPNLQEAGILAEMNIQTEEDMHLAAKKIFTYGPRFVLIKGGHLEGAAVDILYDGHEFFRFPRERLKIGRTHGTGCTLAAALAAFLARGYEMIEAVQEAKNYLFGALKQSPAVGRGGRPVHHLWPYYAFEKEEEAIEEIKEVTK